MRLIICLLFTVVAEIRAEDQLLAAKTHLDFRNALMSQAKTLRSRRVCEAELRNQMVPAHCFRVLYEGDKRESEQRFLYSWLQRRCQASLENESRDNLMYALRYKAFLAGACRRAVESKSHIFRYKIERQRESTLLQQERAWQAI